MIEKIFKDIIMQSALNIDKYLKTKQNSLKKDILGLFLAKNTRSGHTEKRGYPSRNRTFLKRKRSVSQLPVPVFFHGSRQCRCGQVMAKGIPVPIGREFEPLPVDGIMCSEDGVQVDGGEALLPCPAGYVPVHGPHKALRVSHRSGITVDLEADAIDQQVHRPLPGDGPDILQEMVRDGHGRTDAGILPGLRRRIGACSLRTSPALRCHQFQVEIQIPNQRRMGCEVAHPGRGMVFSDEPKGAVVIVMPGPVVIPQYGLLKIIRIDQKNECLRIERLHGISRIGDILRKGAAAAADPIDAMTGG